MSSNFTVKRSDNIGTSLASIGSYTLEANTGAIVVGLTVSNTSTEQVFANVVVNNGTNNFYVVKQALIPANGTLIAVGQGQKIVLQAGDSVQVNSSLSSSVDAMMSIMESTEVGLTVDPVNVVIGGTTGLKDEVSGQSILASALPVGFSLSSVQTNNEVTTSLYTDYTLLEYVTWPTFTGTSSWSTWPVTLEWWSYATNIAGVDRNVPLTFKNTSTSQSTGLVFRPGAGANYINATNTSGTGTGFLQQWSSSSNEGSWIHYVIELSSSTGSTTQADTISYYRNGVQINTLTISSGFPTYKQQGLNAIQFSWFDNDIASWWGYVSEVRLSSGLRYNSSTYTVPTTAFTVDGTTLSLIRSYE